MSDRVGPSLDVDLDIESLKYPELYPLTYL